MRAAAITPGKKDSLRIIDCPVPEPGEGQVLVRVLEAGICGTDIELYEGSIGLAPAGSDFLITGHENFGVVERIGKEVRCLKPGDLVVATVRRPCPERCYCCRNGETDMCLTGGYFERGIKGMHGYMAQYYAEAPDNLIKVPPALKKVGVLLEPLSVVEKAISEVFRIQERLRWKPEKALIAGTGPIGLLAAFALRDIGLDVCAFATREKGSLKARVTEACGAKYVNVKDEPVEIITEHYGPFDISVEATGVSDIAFEMIRKARRDGIICLTGLSPHEGKKTVCMDCVNMDIVMNNKVVFGTVSSNRLHFEKALDRMKSVQGKWPGLLEKMFTRYVSLERIADGMKRDSDDIKVVVEIGNLK